MVVENQWASMNPAPSHGIVASYCTTFLKREMRHVYRQVTGLRRYQTFVMTKSRQNADTYPFEEVEILPRPRINFLSRFVKKYIRRMEPVFYRGEYDQLCAVLGGRDADLMHVYFGHTGVHLLPFIRNWPKPTVVSFHGMDIMLRNNEPGYNDRLRELLRALPLVMARSMSLAKRLEALGADPAKIRINRTGIPLDEFSFRQHHAPTDGRWTVAQACRFIEKKGLPDTLTAFAAFHSRFPKARLILAGEGPMEEYLHKLCQSLGIQEAVEFPGFLTPCELAELYYRAHCLVHPSVTTSRGDQEGVPNALLEAMATGLPVVATRHGGIPEAVREGVDGFLVPENNPHALADALLQLSSNPAHYTSISQESARQVRKEFEESQSIQRLEEIYDEAREKGK
jgi:colanic acid/amylovoran biosynthesis glycosyltransferase